VISYRRRTKKK